MQQLPADDADHDDEGRHDGKSEIAAGRAREYGRRQRDGNRRERGIFFELFDDLHVSGDRTVLRPAQDDPLDANPKFFELVADPAIDDDADVEDEGQAPGKDVHGLHMDTLGLVPGHIAFFKEYLAHEPFDKNPKVYEHEKEIRRRIKENVGTFAFNGGIEA